ncbi:MAG: hypothetical protein IT428_31405 [Planctomycetaceae bacterium]|nr:hypothetical protein [Planctomycetaceae bacterium]
MIKYPEFSDAGDSFKSLLSLVRGGAVDHKAIAHDAWVLSGYALALTVGAPEEGSPPGVLKLSRDVGLPTLDEACDTLTATFDPEVRAAKSMPLVVSSILVILQAAAAKVGPPWGTAIAAAITAILAAAGK